MGYDIKGNITHKKSVGVFDYSSKKTYAIDLISTGEGENQVLECNQDISNNAMMRPSSISEGGKTTNFFYDADASRIKMQTKQGDVEELTRYYIGSQYEYDATPKGTEERLFLDGDAYEAPAVFVKKNQNEYLYYLGRDYLGSITHVLDADGKLLQELRYDAWGRLRKPENHELYAQGSEINPILGSRGYIGHEHLTHYGLINMNARLYDPVVGRFLSPDPYIQAPDFSQNYNRYSYALNNPLLYTDPNGEFIFSTLAFFIPGAQALLPWAIAADIGWMGNVLTNWDNITQNGFDWGKFGAYAGIGLGTGVATYASGGFYAGLGISVGNGMLNQVVKDDFKFTDETLSNGISAGVSYTLTAGLSNGLPGNRGFNLTSKINNLLTQAGMHNWGARKLSEYSVNFFTDFSLAVGTDFITGDIDWTTNLKKSFWSANMSLSFSVLNDRIPNAKHSESEQISNSSSPIELPGTQLLETAVPHSPKSIPNQYNNRYTNKGVVPQHPVIKYNRNSKTFNFDVLKNDRVYKPKK